MSYVAQHSFRFEFRQFYVEPHHRKIMQSKTRAFETIIFVSSRPSSNVESFRVLYDLICRWLSYEAALMSCKQRNQSLSEFLTAEFLHSKIKRSKMLLLNVLEIITLNSYRPLLIFKSLTFESISNSLNTQIDNLYISLKCTKINM